VSADLTTPILTAPCQLASALLRVDTTSNTGSVTSHPDITDFFKKELEINTTASFIKSHLIIISRFPKTREM